MTDTEKPYADGGILWSEAGWSPLPLPPHQKHSPPEGYTGADGIDADAEQVASWVEQRPDANIGVRMPLGVCGIDVDAYKDAGRASWELLQQRCGPLPATWVLTSRTDGVSGIRLFRIPVGVKLRGVAAPGIEVLQHHHRYAVTWPSIHPDTGNIYQLIGPDGDDDGDLPHPEDLPDLPDPWLVELTEKPREPGVIAPRPSTGEWSRAVTAAFAEGMAGMVKGSRHDTALGTVAALARLELQEHPGATDAIESIGNHFRPAVGDRSTEAQAQKEWDDIVSGARSLVRSTGSYRDNYQDLTGGGGFAEVTSLMANGSHPQPQVQGETPTATELLDHGWHPVDLAAVTAEGYEPVQPSMLERSDGAGLLYPGRINALVGESGSGKSFVAQVAAAATLDAGYGVLYVDFEDHAASLVDRLVSLGAPLAAIVERFVYVQPELAYGALAAAELEAIVLDRRVALVVIDSVGEAMALQAQKQNDDDDVARWFRMLPRRLAALGPAVVLVDHVPKAKDAPAGYAIGSQRKRAAVDGAQYRVEQIKSFGRNRAGLAKLTCTKDRNGRHPTNQVAAMFHLDARNELYVPRLEAPANQGDNFRPTTLMERISLYLEGRQAQSKASIENGVKGNRDGLRIALQVLIDEGFVGRHEKGQGIFHWSEKPFRVESDEPLMASPEDPPEVF